METHIETTQSNQHSWIYILGEIVLVFLPAFLLIKVTSPWVGEDPIRSFTVIWVANILMLVMVWQGTRLRGGTLMDFGLSFKKFSLTASIKTFGLSWLVFVVGISAYLLGPVIMSFFTDIHPEANFSKYDFLKDNLGGLLLSLIGVYIVSSFGEEVIYRAFLINRISELTKGTKYSGTIAVILSTIFFGSIHYEWGLIGMIQTGCMGLVMGISYIKLKKRLWILVLAHAYMDTILLVQLYMVSN